MDRPSELPEWASNPSAGTITDPDDTQKQSGWTTSTLIRQFVNWFWNLVWQWIVWLDQTTHRTNDLHPDHALQVGSPPTIGSGRTISAGNFSARVYANGYEVPLTSWPAAGNSYTYSANSDTYWDLREDGTWIPAVVSSGGSAPAVAAYSTRVYMVRTNASDRTALTDFRSSFLQLLGNPAQTNNSLWLGRGMNQTLGGVNGHAPIEWTRGPAQYTLMGRDSGSTIGVRHYKGNNAFGGAGVCDVEVMNAYWDEASSIWVCDQYATNVFALFKTTLFWVFLTHAPGDGHTFADSIGGTDWIEIWSMGFAGVESQRDLSAANITAGTNIHAGQDITAARDYVGTRDVIAGRIVQAGSHMYATSGNVETQRTIASQASDGTPIVGGTYQGNTQKAWGWVHLVSGTITASEGFGCTISHETITAGGTVGAIHVELANPIPSGRMKINPHLMLDSAPTSIGGTLRPQIIDASNFRLVIDGGSGSFLDMDGVGSPGLMMCFDVDGYN